MVEQHSRQWRFPEMDQAVVNDVRCSVRAVFKDESNVVDGIVEADNVVEWSTVSWMAVIPKRWMQRRFQGLAAE